MRRPCLLLLSLMTLGACQADELAPFLLDARLELGERRVDLGAVPIGTTEGHAVSVTNNGQIALGIEVTFEPSRPAVSAAPEALFLDVGQSAALSILFTPDLPGSFTSRMQLFAADSGELLGAVVVVGSGYAPSCDDHNPCTDDLFDLALRACQHSHRQGSCDDGLRCTEDDRCYLGSCLGSAVVCDDGVACTIDACDEEQGCRALPDDARCAGDGPCQQGRCDAQRGCMVEAAPDGTTCGPIDCASMSLCIQGQCRSSPTPDGLPCDDGDPCTAGDACLAGVCAPGPEDARAISVPIDFDPNHPLSSAWPQHPVAVLAVDAPAYGGLDMVWLADPGTGAAELNVMRSGVDADGALAYSVLHARAQRASAVFHDGDLYLLLSGCSTCGNCELELRRFPGSSTSASAASHYTCLDDGMHRATEVTLAVDAQGVYVAQAAEAIDPWGETELCYTCGQPDLPAAIAARCWD